MAFPITLLSVAEASHREHPIRQVKDVLRLLIEAGRQGFIEVSWERPPAIPELMAGRRHPDHRPSEINGSSRCKPLEVCLFWQREFGENAPEEIVELLPPEQRRQFTVVGVAAKLNEANQRKASEIAGAMLVHISKSASKYRKSSGEPNCLAIGEALEAQILAATGNTGLPHGWRSLRDSFFPAYLEAYLKMIDEAKV